MSAKSKKGVSSPGSAKRKSALSVPRALATVVPNTLRTKMRYVQYNALDPAAGAFSTYVYQPSSLYDPDYTGVGHQPLGFDQLAALYAHYVVHSCDINVHYYPSGISGNPVAWGIILTHDNGVTGPWNKLAEQDPKLSRYTTVSGTAGSPMKPSTLTLHYDAQKVTGRTDLADSDLMASVAASPVDNFFFVVWTQAVDLSADVSNAYFIVDLTFDASFFVKKDLAQS